MSNSYYNAEHLSKFGRIGEFQKEVADKFFGWYGEVFKDSALTAKEKSMMPLPHVQPPSSGLRYTLFHKHHYY